MPTRIYIQPTIADARARAKKDYFNSLGLKGKVGEVRIADCYTIDKELNQGQIEKAKALLTNPLFESAATEARTPKKYHYAIEIGFLPGVTDNVGQTTRETLEDGLKTNFTPAQNIYTSQVFFITLTGAANRADAEKIKDSLYNPLIQRAAVKTVAEYEKQGGMDLFIPRVKMAASSKVLDIDLNIDDEKLEALGWLGIMEEDGTRRGPLSLSLSYLKAIRSHFAGLKRQPTDVELETLAQTWSEHCKHTIFADPMDEIEKGIYKTYIKGATEAIRKKKNAEQLSASTSAKSVKISKDKLSSTKTSGGKDFCVSVFTDNSGAIVFDENYLITHKVETHNTPSALDPFGGSITGIVGVNRDCLGFGLGAKPIINLYGFCLADPEDKTELYRDRAQTQKMLSARRIMEGVVSGINAGGNQSGIPTNLGFIFFEPRFRGKPLVFAGTVGLIKREINSQPSHIKRARSGDLIVMAGGRVGADGIHGATFSSVGLDTNSPATAVQIGDPITQKKMSDALIKEARDQGLYSSLTDCGAGGLSSAVGEMASATGGCEVDLEKVPLKYPGLAPWQIWISESQERMVLAVPEKNWPKFCALMAKRGVEAAVIGKFTDSGKCIVKFNGQAVMNLDMEFLHDGRPVKKQATKKPQAVKAAAVSLPKAKDYSGQVLDLLAGLNIGSFEFISKQYDHEVQAGSVLKPLQGRGRINAEATVTRPVLSSKKAVVLSSALYPVLSELDPYKMAAMSIDGAIRAAVAAGANVDYLALLDNFCWSSSDEPLRLGQLKEAARACYDYATAYGTPFISGKDSMYNDFKGFDKKAQPIKISIPPTLLISAIGVIPDWTKAVSLEAKAAGDLIYILGETQNQLGGSEYVQMLKAEAKGRAAKLSLDFNGVPGVDAKKNYELYQAVYQAGQKNLLASAISVSRGGLAIALAKTLLGGKLGGKIEIDNLPGDWKETYEALFSESAGRILVTVSKKNQAVFEKILAGQSFACLGQTDNSKDLKIFHKNKSVIKLNIDKALIAYKSRLKNY